MARIAHFKCTRCGECVAPDAYERNLRAYATGTSHRISICARCSGMLLIGYDLPTLRKSINREMLAAPARPPDLRSGSSPLWRAAGMWRYGALLPDLEPLTLGEGFTPLLPSRENPNVLVKEEGLNPTGTFKARGLCLTVAAARHYGLNKLAIPSAGNAAAALAAYSAAAGLECCVFMPNDVPRAILLECQSHGAQVTLVDGLISDCARLIAERKQAEGLFDVSMMSVPFRVEGKKTMGYEVAEQMDWTLPDAIIYPTGGGLGLFGLWKSFDEMEQLGWLRPGTKRPRMIAVQPTGCAPIVKAWDEGKPASERWRDAHTIAAGLRVPKAFGDYLVLEIVRASGGAAIAVTDEEIMDALIHWARVEGIFAAPEGAACRAAYRRLLASGALDSADKVVLFNTGSGLKYVDVIAGSQKPRHDQPKLRALGGIIQPF
jgi:threonine synthase